MGKPYKLPSQEELTTLLDYSVVTGQLFWKQSRGRVRKGSVAGSLGPNGYYVVRIDKRGYPVNRIVWRMITGDDPGSMCVNHIDEVKHNNAWHNLELLSSRDNTRYSVCTQGLPPYISHNNGTSYIVRYKGTYLGARTTLKGAIELLESHNIKTPDCQVPD